MALRWGIAAAGKISHDFVTALATLSLNEHKVVAIAARNLSRAQEFAQRFDIKNAYEGYLKLAEDPNVQVVYIGTINPQHLEVAKLMLEHGKHVLIEKPMTMNEKQSRQLVIFAENKNLFLMEGIWSRFFPSYQYVHQQIKSGALGDIVSVEIEFGFPIASVENISKKSLGGGTVINMGIYPIQLCQWVFRQAPKSITATGKLNDDGVDVEMTATIVYGDNKVGRIRSSVLEELGNVAKIIGTTGTITIPTFWAPTVIIDVVGTEKSWPLPETKAQFNFPNSCGLRYEADEVRKCIRSGKAQSEHVTHNDSLLFAQIEDEIRKQIGVKYPQDD